MDEKREIDYVEYPKWYLKILSKMTRRDDRQLLGFLIPLAFAVIIAIFVWNYVFLNHIYGGGYIAIIILILTFIIFYYLSRRLFITKNAKYDRFEIFAYHCGEVGLDLAKLSLIPDYNHYMPTEITQFQINCWLIRRKYKSPDDKKIKESLKGFSKSLNYLILLLGNIEDNKDKISELSDRFLELGEYVSYPKKPRLDEQLLMPITQSLNELKEQQVKDKIITSFRAGYDFLKKSARTRKGIVVLVSLILSIALFLITHNFVGLGWAIAVGVTTFLATPPCILAIRHL